MCYFLFLAVKVGLEPLLHIDGVTCYHYTTPTFFFSILNSNMSKNKKARFFRSGFSFILIIIITNYICRPTKHKSSSASHKRTTGISAANGRLINMLLIFFIILLFFFVKISYKYVSLIQNVTKKNAFFFIFYLSY